MVHVRWRHAASLALALAWLISRASAEGPRTGLVEGKVAIHRGDRARYGPLRAALTKVWEYGRGGKSEQEWLEQRYGKKRVLFLGISGTPYSLLVIDGAVTPLVSVSGPFELWRIEGLEDFCKITTALDIGEKKATLVASGGDMRSILLLDFTRGLSLRYREEYDGF